MAGRSSILPRVVSHKSLIPVIRDGQTIALLQCGQVHDRAPSAAEWKEARKSLVSAGIRARGLRALFQRNRVLTAARQDDLLELLAPIAARLAHSDERELRTSPGQTQAALGRAMTYIETHLSAFDLIYPILLLVFMTRPKVVAAFYQRQMWETWRST